MEKYVYSFTCPICGEVLCADSEEETIREALNHTQELHDMDLDEDKVRDMVCEEVGILET